MTAKRLLGFVLRAFCFGDFESRAYGRLDNFSTYVSLLDISNGFVRA